MKADFRDLPLGTLRDLAEMTITVAAAYDTGIFEALSAGPADAAELASRLKLSRRGVEIVLPVLVELELLRRDGEAYALSSSGRTLADTSEASAGSGLPLWLLNLRAWTRLPEALRSGAPPEDEGPGGVGDDPETLARYMAGMAAAPAARIRKVVEHCLERNPEARTVLDLGGGPGHMARAFAETGLEVTLMDSPATIDFVREAYALGRIDRLRLVEGDFLGDPLPEGPFDIVLLSNILHIYSPDADRRLLRSVSDITAPRGVAAIGEFVRGRSPRAARFAIVMLLRTEGGNTYSESEYRRWMEDAGFGAVETVDIDDDRQLVSGIRR